jgi:hypothetical protein
MNKTIQKHALALALVVAIGSVQAQSTTGGIVGSVANGAGKTVLVENTSSGFSREVQVDERGRYSVANLPLGTYKVTVKQDGAAVESRESIGLTVGASTDVSFGGSTAGVQTLDGVSVKGARSVPIDVTQVDTRTVVSASNCSSCRWGVRPKRSHCWRRAWSTTAAASATGRSVGRSPVSAGRPHRRMRITSMVSTRRPRPTTSVA